MVIVCRQINLKDAISILENDIHFGLPTSLMGLVLNMPSLRIFYKTSLLVSKNIIEVHSRAIFLIIAKELHKNSVAFLRGTYLWAIAANLEVQSAVVIVYL